MSEFDVIIVGSGIIGLATACALGNTALRVAVIDNKKIPLVLPSTPCLRASAINSSSQRYFSQLGIWDELINSDRVLTFNHIQVREKHSFASFEAHSDDYHYDNLGHIIENDLLIATLYRQIKTYTNIQFFPQKVGCLSIDDNSVMVRMDNEKFLTGQLIVAADGANSWVRRTTGSRIWQYPYRHHAIISTVTTEKRHYACARQVFYSDGIIAFLPLWHPHQHCLVWSAKPKDAHVLQHLKKSEFNHRLMSMTQYWLGKCDVISERHSFPLIARYTPNPVRHRLIFIGDASHTIHPLAGQGANLGLRDSRELVSRLLKLKHTHKDIGLKPH